jgi:spore germination protein GerM
VALALCAACSVPTQRNAERIDDDQVPFGLLEDSDSTSPTSAAPAPGTAVIYLVEGDRLVPVNRAVPSTDASTMIDALLAGPTEAESSEGLHSALVDVDDVNLVETRGPVATVDLASGFTDAAPIEQRLAVAQLTLTATEAPDIATVRFTLDGSSISVPRADGTTSEGPVSRRDYVSLLQPARAGGSG